MSGGITFSVDSSSNKLRVTVDTLPELMRLQLRNKIDELTHQLLRLVEAREPRRTGRLQSLTQAYVDDNRAKNFVRGRVRVLRTKGHNTAAAAGALEYGSTGRKFPVRSYKRKSGHSVKAYDRRGGITELRFLRGPAASMLPRARREIEQVILATTKAALKP